MAEDKKSATMTYERLFVQSGTQVRRVFSDPTPVTNMPRPAVVTPAEYEYTPELLLSQPLTRVTSDLPPYKFRSPANMIVPIKIPLNSSEGMVRSNSISPRSDRTKSNRTPTYELHNPMFLRPLSHSEGVEAASVPSSPSRPHTSTGGTDSSTSPRSGYESSGKLRTGTSSLNIFADDEERNKSRTPRMEVKVERNILMLDRIAEEEDNIVVNDEDEDGQKVQKQPPKQEKIEEEVEDTGSGPDSVTDSPAMEVFIFFPLSFLLFFFIVLTQFL